MASDETTSAVSPFPPSGLGAWIFVIVAATTMLQPFAEAMPNHGADTSWPAHAQFHLASGLATQFFLGFAAILVARVPYRRGEAWSWWVLAGFALSMVSLIPATLWFGSGPAQTFWPLIGAQIVAMLVALAATAPMPRAR